MYNRNPGIFENTRNGESLRKIPSFEPEPKPMYQMSGYYDGYTNLYTNPLGMDYPQPYISSFEYDASEDFPSLTPANPPGFMSDEFYPPPGFSKPLKTRAPNPNAVSFVPSYVSAPPLKDEREEKELKEFGVQSIVNLQKNVNDDKGVLARGKDLSLLEINKKSSECMSSYLNSTFDQELEISQVPEFSLPDSYRVKKAAVKAGMIRLFVTETLFYVFYNMPGELMQAMAAEELYRREWLYNPAKQLWFLNSEGQWKYFDINRFEISATQTPSGPYLTKEEICVKQKQLA